MRLLLVDDDRRLAENISKGLREEGHFVEAVESAEAAESCLACERFDVLLLDWRLPGFSGLDLVARLRGRGNRIPIIMMTAMDGLADKVSGLDAGADDYLVKPFAVSELAARVRAVTRRVGQPDATRIQVGDLVVDTLKREVRRGARVIDLTAREFQLLQLLVRNRDRVLTRTTIGDYVWGIELGSSNVIDVHVGRLRAKLEEGGEERLLHTVRGMGYRFSAAVP
jgi:DNA-binding response OmpR family regulator